jgi:hypothetical protein
MHTDDFEKFERFGLINSPGFRSINQLEESSSLVVNKERTQRRDKRALRVATFAPLAGGAIGGGIALNRINTDRQKGLARKVGEGITRAHHGARESLANVIRGKKKAPTSGPGKLVHNVKNRANKAGLKVLQPRELQNFKHGVKKGAKYGTIGGLAWAANRLVNKRKAYKEEVGPRDNF